jgi:hypothetical protein
MPKPDTVPNWIVNEIQTVPGHKRGARTRAQYSIIKQNCFGRTGGQEGCSTQDMYMVYPATEQREMYISFWRKLQPDLLHQVGRTSRDHSDDRAACPAQ